jgi:hypothetical protein
MNIFAFRTELSAVSYWINFTTKNIVSIMYPDIDAYLKIQHTRTLAKCVGESLRVENYNNAIVHKMTIQEILAHTHL